MRSPFCKTRTRRKCKNMCGDGSLPVLESKILRKQRRQYRGVAKGRFVMCADGGRGHVMRGAVDAPSRSYPMPYKMRGVYCRVLLRKSRVRRGKTFGENDRYIEFIKARKRTDLFLLYHMRIVGGLNARSRKILRSNRETQMKKWFLRCKKSMFSVKHSFREIGYTYYLRCLRRTNARVWRAARKVSENIWLTRGNRIECRYYWRIGTECCGAVTTIVALLCRRKAQKEACALMLSQLSKRRREIVCPGVCTDCGDVDFNIMLSLFSDRQRQYLTSLGEAHC